MNNTKNKYTIRDLSEDGNKVTQADYWLFGTMIFVVLVMTATIIVGVILS